jgi:hypothetical protein
VAWVLSTAAEYASLNVNVVQWNYERGRDVQHDRAEAGAGADDEIGEIGEPGNHLGEPGNQDDGYESEDGEGGGEGEGEGGFLLPSQMLRPPSLRTHRSSTDPLSALKPTYWQRRDQLVHSQTERVKLLMGYLRLQPHTGITI